MEHEIDLSKYNIRTDLVLDDADNNNLNLDIENKDDIKITRVDLDEENAVKLGKRKGYYTTIEFEDITDSTNFDKVLNVFNFELVNLINNLNIEKDDRCLVIGLGNKASTPDCLGPLAVENIIVTHHLYSLNLGVDSSYRDVAAVSPGVTGETGIETSDIVLKLVEIIKPKFLIVIDSLASTSINRVNKTIQMSDTGINPGSGIGNSRKEISIDTIGIPVIAIGIPTVVDAVTIVSDTIGYMEKHFSYKKSRYNKKSEKLIPSSTNNYLRYKNNPLSTDDKKNLMGLLGGLNDDEMRNLIYDVLSPIGYNLMVTPKEIDFLIKKLSKLISTGINKSIHNID